MRWPDGLDIGIGLCADWCISEIPQHAPFCMKEEALPVCKETIALNEVVALKGPSLQQI